jgi:hypothetical protein
MSGGKDKGAKPQGSFGYARTKYDLYDGRRTQDDPVP